MQVLVTGGAGYIGSHTMVELLSAGHEVVCIDNLVNASQEAVRRVEAITGKNIIFYPYDVGDRQRMKEIFAAHRIDAVIHFAGHKAVGESVTNPLRYYTNNVGMTFTLCEVMADYGCKNLVFSSSATVYGDPVCVPITENAMVDPTNPYGRTKLMIEQVLGDLSASDPNWNIVVLRYFNPIGAHESGMLGEDPRGIPNNLLPFISQVAVGKRDKLYIFGDDYPTPDGTGVRDYVHVVDLAKGHVSALDKGLTWTRQEKAVLTVNLGTGTGHSVLEVVKAFERACNIQIPYEIVAHRPGDVAAGYANVDRAYELLGWKSEFDLERMCEDAWRWQSANLDGYADSTASQG